MDPTPLSILRKSGGAVLVNRLLGLFETTTRQKLDELAAAIERGDRARIVESAHYIKGGAASIGVRPVVEAAERLENCAAAGEVIGLRDQLRILRDQFHAGLDLLHRCNEDADAFD
jgi:HPt (histidine-containing phosphotransfer) domain-containing protein